MFVTRQARRLDLERLKQKVDAGADLIISQFFYDTSLFLDFHKACRDMGIRCPILPGYMVAQTYSNFQKCTAWCRSRVPSQLQRDLRDTMHDDEGVKRVAIKVRSA